MASSIQGTGTRLTVDPPAATNPTRPEPMTTDSHSPFQMRSYAKEQPSTSTTLLSISSSEPQSQSLPLSLPSQHDDSIRLMHSTVPAVLNIEQPQSLLSLPSMRDDNMHPTGPTKGIKSLQKTVKLAIYAARIADRASGPDEEHDVITEAQLAENIFETQLADGAIPKGPIAKAKKQKTKAVLGKKTLQQIRDDMARIELPSWFTAAPKRPGEAMWGRFKADEWKSFCTVNLPITLTRLWGSRPNTDRHYQMLENFLQLVAGINLANKRIITDDDINLYEDHMRKYLTGFRLLYPFKDIVPYQHLSLHFPSHLRRFGPTHSWRCWAFERFNGLIQVLPTNNKFGK